MENEILNNEVVETAATEVAEVVTKKPNAVLGGGLLVGAGVATGILVKTAWDKFAAPKIKKAKLNKQAKKDRNATVEAEAEIVEDFVEE